jgi:hypothetical protein
LDSLQQSPPAPFILKPINRHLRQTTLGIAATTAVANRNLPHYQALRFQWVVAMCVQDKTPSDNRLVVALNSAVSV